MLFTAIYIYVAIHSMPSRNVKRPTTSKNRNITSKIVSKVFTIIFYAFVNKISTYI